MIASRPERSSQGKLKCIKHRKERVCRENTISTWGGQDLHILPSFHLQDHPVRHVWFLSPLYFYHKEASVVKWIAQDQTDISCNPVTLCQGDWTWSQCTFQTCSETHVHMKAHTIWWLKNRVNNEKKICCAAEFNNKKYRRRLHSHPGYSTHSLWR